MRKFADAVMDAVMQGYEIQVRPVMLDGRGRVTALTVNARQEVSPGHALMASRCVFLDSIVPAMRETVLAVEVDDAAEELKNALARKDRSTPSTSAR